MHGWIGEDSMILCLEASLFVQTIEKRQGMKISCIEEIAFRMGYISKNNFNEALEIK